MAEETKSKIGYLLERLAMGVAAHDRENPDHTSWGVGMAHFDIERLGLEVVPLEEAARALVGALRSTA